LVFLIYVDYKILKGDKINEWTRFNRRNQGFNA
jgi:hypothetical protein